MMFNFLKPLLLLLHLFDTLISFLAELILLVTNQIIVNDFFCVQICTVLKSGFCCFLDISAAPFYVPQFQQLFIKEAVLSDS
jgi:hypothetical protein